jgi:RNA polymerase sigma factor (sigma-70 family)
MHNERLRDICERFKSGNEDAFKELYDALAGRVFSYVVPRAASREDALDMLQEIFLALWSARLRFTYHNDALLYGFVFTIARRTLASHYERNRHDKAVSELPQDDRYDLDVDAIGDVRMIEEALAGLSDDDRDLITLRHWNGLSFQEIGKIKDKTETAVRVQHHRALGRLKESLPHHDS